MSWYNLPYISNCSRWLHMHHCWALGHPIQVSPDNSWKSWTDHFITMMALKVSLPLMAYKNWLQVIYRRDCVQLPTGWLKIQEWQMKLHQFQGLPIILGGWCHQDMGYLDHGLCSKGKTYNSFVCRYHWHETVWIFFDYFKLILCIYPFQWGRDEPTYKTAPK